MDQPPNVSSKYSLKPSKLLVVGAFALVSLLPFIFVKLFTSKQNTLYSVQAHSATQKNQSQQTKKHPKQLAQHVKKPEAPLPINGWQTIEIRKGDTLSSIFYRLKLNHQTLQEIIQAGRLSKKTLSRLKTNQKLQFLVENNRLEKMIIPYTPLQFITIARQGNHYKSMLNTYPTQSHNRYVSATVRGSLYNTAKRNNIPYKLIKQLTEIFTSNIDFAKNIRAGDQFSIIYKGLYVGDKWVGAGDILAATYKNRGITFQAVRYTHRSGSSEYFTPQGTSLKKAFTRYPVHFSHIGSTFSLSRYHPILHYSRPHKGVDLAASIGTPIHATSDGRIAIIGRQSGYGNMIKINHNRTFSTIYGHMLRFQKGLSRGSYVKRGQVIGYVGQTGLATGPHCHYEFHVNKQPKNPVTIDLPRGDPVPSRELSSFKANTNQLLAQLKLYEKSRLASVAHPKHLG